MWGITPPRAMVALIKASSSSSPRMANVRCLGVMRFVLLSLATLPASSRTSAAKYSQTAATYTPAVAPTRVLFVMYDLRIRWIRPTGKCTPARAALEAPSPLAFFFPDLPNSSLSSGRLPMDLSFSLPFFNSFSLSLSFWKSSAALPRAGALPPPGTPFKPLSASPVTFFNGLSVLTNLPSRSPTIFLEPFSLPISMPVIFLEPFSLSKSSPSMAASPLLPARPLLSAVFFSALSNSSPMAAAAQMALRRSPRERLGAPRF
mmetsp:Transcript_56020/g.170535  ORF Transcript_56020/g.170535 Transcript_56020/m.170535 type:complete len:261 (-) Transcript_56020:34-816(-)